MPDPKPTRRAFLATAAGVTATLAGCSGEDGDDGAGGPSGELVLEETIDDLGSWSYELEPGDTITVEIEAEGGSVLSSINRAEDPSGGDLADLRVSGGETDSLTFTAENDWRYRVSVTPRESATVRIYV